MGELALNHLVFCTVLAECGDALEPSFMWNFLFPQKRKNQPHPKVSRQDVDRIVRRDFPSDLFDEITAILAEYGVKDYVREKERVQLAVLKLAAGSLDKLPQLIDAAKADYRDVLSGAECPLYAREGFQTKELSVKEYNGIIEADWKQYSDWLLR